MSIKVRYFASLKEILGRDGDELDSSGIATVSDVWQKANPDKTPPRHMLAALNLEHVSMDTPVKDHDIVAFFPPVTGG